MAYFVAILTLSKGCLGPWGFLCDAGVTSLKGMRSIISMVSISLEDFMPSILLLMVIIVAAVIVTVIWALQVTDTDSRLLLIAGPLLLQFLGASCTQREVSMVIFGRISPNSFLSSILLLVVIIVMVVFVVVIAIVRVVIVVVFGIIVVVVPLVSGFLLVLSVFAMLASCAFKAVATLSATSCRMTSKVMAGVSDVDVLLGGILSIEDNTYYGMIHGDGDNDTNDGDDDEIKYETGLPL
ncbi:hypothetical protein Tco_1235534 [Tanacetum coccineum]